MSSMSDIAIRCEGLSKRYRIGGPERYKALRDALTDAGAAPFRRLRSAFDNGNGSATRNSKLETRNSFWALDDVSFEVKHGEVVGIIGRNGAGKSTLLKILARITKPTKGQAKIHGRVGSLLEVGTGFHPELTGRENIYLNGAILGMHRAEMDRKFDEIVAFAEVEKFLETPVKRYSSGMQMRLAFAVAAHLEPEIVLVDEVLAVGDFEFQKKCIGKMQEIGRSGRTVLFVSHSMPTVQRLCDRAILLVNGSRAVDSSVAEAVRKYLSDNVSSTYLGAAIEGKTSITRATLAWNAIDGLLVEASFISPLNLCPPMLGLVLYDAEGTPVFGTNPRFDVHAHIPRSMNAGTIRVRISTEALRHDTYYMSLWLGDQYQDYCHLDHALSVDIGTGSEESWRPPRHAIGNIRLETEWHYSLQNWNGSETVAL